MAMAMAIAGRVALRPPVPSTSLFCFHNISCRFPVPVSSLRTRRRMRSCWYKAGTEIEMDMGIEKEIEKEMGMEWVSRKEGCGELKGEDIGKRVRLCGWVALHRLHSSLTFFNLRDHTGIVQVSPQKLYWMFPIYTSKMIWSTPQHCITLSGDWIWPFKHPTEWHIQFPKLRSVFLV